MPYEFTSTAKHTAEVGFLLFTPVWCTLCASIMVTGVAEHWGDWELMTFGVSMAVLTLVFALWYIRRTLSHTPKLAKRATDYCYAIYAGVVTLSFAANYLQTPFFFDVLHMRYGFNVTIRLDPFWQQSPHRNPVFLYFLTVAYFATYCSGGSMLFRFVRQSRLMSSIVVPTPIVIFVVATLLAFLETITNANPFARRLFCYEDTGHALIFGSITYGICFVLALPGWLWYGGVPEDDSNNETRSILCAHAVVVNLAVAIVDALILNFVVEPYVAPYFTVVHKNAGPLGQCLRN